MRHTISGLVAAIAVVTAASASPALACGGGLFQSSCSPCGQAYVSPCAQTYVPAPVYTGCNTGCGGWGYERLAEPEQQYYYVNQGPTYTGPGNFAPYPTYQEGSYYHRPHRYGYGGGYATTHEYGGAGYGYRTHPHYGSWHHGYRPSYRYGYAPHHTMRYGAGMMPYHYGHREHVLRRYY